MSRSVIEQNGWRLWVAEYNASTPALVATALAVANGTGKRRQAGQANLPQLLRRSRHAATYQVQSGSGDATADLFIKCFDPPTRMERLKACFRGSRAGRVERNTASLTSAGFSAPQILLRGVHRQSRRELLVTARAEGDGPLMTLNRVNGSIAAKWALLRALGTEIARLHRAGFIHGDLTPFNIRIVAGEPPRFAFLDNDRTRRNVLIARGRHRLRNLVQLGRFALPGLTRTDRMRVFRAYEAALHHAHSHLLQCKAATMLTRRMRRDQVTNLGRNEPQRR